MAVKCLVRRSLHLITIYIALWFLKLTFINFILQLNVNDKAGIFFMVISKVALGQIVAWFSFAAIGMK